MSLLKIQVRHGLKEQVLNNEKTCSLKAIKHQCCRIWLMMQLNSQRCEGLTLPEKNLPLFTCQNLSWISVFNAQSVSWLKMGRTHVFCKVRDVITVFLWACFHFTGSKLKGLSRTWESRSCCLVEASFCGTRHPSSCWIPASGHLLASPNCKGLPGSCSFCRSGCLLYKSLLWLVAPCPCAGWFGICWATAAPT